MEYVENGVLYNVVGGRNGTLLLYEGRSKVKATVIAKLSHAELQILYFKNGNVVKLERNKP